MPDILITEFMDDGAIELLSRSFSVHYDKELPNNKKELYKLVGDIKALIVRNKTNVNKELIARAPKLKVVGRLGVGLDNIAMDICKARDIRVYRALGANSVAVAEYVIMASLLLLRNVLSCRSDVIAGRWPRESFIGEEISDKVMGFIGFGNTGQATALRARGLGLGVIVYDPYLSDESCFRDINDIERVSKIDDLLKQAHIISLHIPLTDETRNLVDAKFISKLKPGAVLINTSRGGIVDELALIAALKRGHLGGAAVDVFENEPLDATRGALFADIPNLLLTPHIGGVTKESNKRVSFMIANKIINDLRGI